MDKFVVTVVKSESDAYQLLKKLDQLDTDGLIELHAACVVRKEQDGRMTVVKTDDQHGLATVVAAALGAFLGLLAGPTGVAVGAVAGGGAGFAGETAYSGITGEYLDTVSRAIAPGAFAVFAEIDEKWTLPIDDAASALGAGVFRQAVGDVIRAEMKAADDAAREELAQLEAEITRATGEMKGKLEAKRDAAKAAYERYAEKRRAKIEQIQKSWDAKLASVQEKARRAKDVAKVRHEEHARKLATFVAQQKESYRQLFA